MTLDDRVQALRLPVFRRAYALSNVIAACREVGVSSSRFYRLRKRFDRYGQDGLHPRRDAGRPERPPQLRGSILHEHWRVEFRRRYCIRIGQLGASLQGYLRFYNHERTHRGHQTRGRTPAEIVWGARDDVA